MPEARSALGSAAAPATIGLIWQILYPIIVVSFGFVFVQAIRKKVPWPVALPFAINLVTNLIFTPIQVPYLVWVSIATVLQLSITVMNWGRA